MGDGPKYNETELAAYLRVTEDAVRKAERRGAIHRDTDGLFDPVQATSDWLRNRRGIPGPGRKRKGMPTAPPVSEAGGGRESGESLLEVQTRHELVKIEERELKLEKARGDVVDKRVEQRRLAELIRAMSERIQNWPADVAPRLAAVLGIDPVRMEIELEREVRALLASMVARDLAPAGEVAA